MQSHISERIIFLGPHNYNKCNLHVFLLYVNVILSYSFKVVSAITKEVNVLFTAILEIAQDAMPFTLTSVLC